MTEAIDKYIGEKNYEQAVQESQKNYPLLTEILVNMYNIKLEKFTKVKLLCNWCSSEELAKIWNKMSKGNFTWNNIRIVWDDSADYYVVINAPQPGENFPREKTIVFQMEPNMKINKMWGEWADPDPKKFLKVCKHSDGEYNNNEWHLSKTYFQLLTEPIVKTENVLAVVISDKYSDIGHIKRTDFVKFLESKGMPVHVYGSNRWDYKDYRGSLPYHCKDNGIFPYKYVLNVENNEIPYYYTEKLIDGILGECLTFYWGCPNIRELIDPRAYGQLTLSNFENDYAFIKKAIDEDWHTERLPYIKNEKRRILTELQFFPRLEKILYKK